MVWSITYTKDGMEIRYDDGNDVWLKTIPYAEIIYGMTKFMQSSIYGSTKEDRSNGTH